MNKKQCNELMKRVEQLEEELERNKTASGKHVINIPLPKPISLEGNVRENVELFERTWQNYCIASGLIREPEKIKKSVLLSVVGEEIFRVYVKAVPQGDEIETADALLKVIKYHLIAAVNVRYERYVFNTVKQQEDESYGNYILKIKGMIRNCQFGEMEDELLLDKIICSIKDGKLQEVMWLKKDIKLEEAIDMCKAKELADKQLSIVAKRSYNEINKLDEPGRNKYEKKIIKPDEKYCKFCGYEAHKNKKCPAYGLICKLCGKKNHFASACFRRKNRSINEVNNDQEEEEEKDVLEIESNENRGMKINLKFMKKNGKFEGVECQLDTGASCNVIGMKNLSCLHGEKPRLKHSSTRLKVFGGQILIPRGQISLKVRHKEKEYELCFEVVDYDHCPLLSAETCALLNLIQICYSIERKQELVNIMDKYGSVFEGLGEFAGEIELEMSNDMKPVRCSPRRVPVAIREQLREEINEMLKLGVIEEEPNYTEWVSNLVVVKKPNGKLRVCLDPSQLNKAIKDTKQQLPTLDEILPELSKAKIFSTVDAKQGFWQIKLSKESAKKTAFWTPFGKFKYVRLPFGITTAMEQFQKKMLEALVGLKGVFVIADDILIVGRGDTEVSALKDHNINFEELLQRLEQLNIKLNREKTNLCKNSIKFYGHILSGEGIRPNPEKISAIENMEAPRDKAGVQRFLGLINYHGRFIKNLSEDAVPLRALIRDKHSFTWGSEEEKSFKKLKEAVSKEAILKYYDINKPVTIQTDASSKAMGCVLLQEGLPVAYASKVMTKTQQNYAQIEKEMLAVVFACQKFDQYICGKRDVTVETDHSPLITIVKKPLLKAPRRLQSMLLTLQRYAIKLMYRRGKEVVIADTLSRAPENEGEDGRPFELYEIFRELDDVESLDGNRVCESTIERIKLCGETDEEIQALKKVILEGWPNNKSKVPNVIRAYWKWKSELTVAEGLVLKENRIITPKKLRKELLDKLHTAHAGIEGTMKLGKQTVFWPSINMEIKNKVGQCWICKKFAPNQRPDVMITHEIPQYPFERVGMDIFEIYINGNKRKFLLIVDHYSDFFEIDEVRTMSAKDTIVACKRVFSRYGVPEVVVSDNGTNFVSQEFDNFRKEWKFKHVTSSPHHQQGNGKAEAAVKIAKSLIMKAMESKEDFYKALLNWRNTPNKIGSSPAKRMMCRWLRCDLPCVGLKQEICGNTQDSIRKNRQYFRKYYNKKAVRREPLKEGDEVWVKKTREEKTWTRGKIVDCHGDRSYNVEMEGGGTLRRNQVMLKKK